MGIGLRVEALGLRIWGSGQAHKVESSGLIIQGMKGFHPFMVGILVCCIPGNYHTLRVQVPNNHILTQNLYYNYYYPKPKYLIIGYLDPLGYTGFREASAFRVFSCWGSRLCLGACRGRRLKGSGFKVWAQPKPQMYVE